MTIYPLAIQRPGPGWKRWSDGNTHAGAVLHSMEGYEHGAWSVLDGTAYASWHLSVMQDGRVFQHYPIDQSPWHAGNKGANLTLVGIEHEGVAGEALTALQLAASKALVQWLAAEGGWTASRAPGRRTLYEHNEIGTTNCPSGRIPWAEYEETPVRAIPLDTAETLEAFNAVAKRLGGVMFDDAGETMERVIDPPPPPGYGRVVVTYRL